MHDDIGIPAPGPQEDDMSPRARSSPAAYPAHVRVRSSYARETRLALLEGTRRLARALAELPAWSGVTADQRARVKQTLVLLLQDLAPRIGNMRPEARRAHAAQRADPEHSPQHFGG